MQFKVVFQMIGKLLIVIGTGMILPFIASIYYQEKDVWVFAFCIPLTVFSGILLTKLCATTKHIRNRDGFAIVTYGWLIASFFGMLPYLLSGSIPHVVDAYFETIAGFTTTGSSILNDVESLSHSILLWRSMTQWLGGMGILVLFIAILSSGGSSGLQLYKAEMPGIIAEKLTPRISDNAKIMWIIYLIFTFAGFLAFFLCGMPIFDSLCHSFSTVSTGGFSTKNASLSFYDSGAVEMVASILMFLCAINFAVYYRTFFYSHKLKTFFKTTEVRAYFAVTIICSLLVSANLFLSGYMPFLESLQKGTFQVISTITTTSFAIDNYEQWPTFSLCLIILLFFCGGCTSSTSGSIKIDRYVILFRQAYADIQRYLHPRLVSRQKLNNAVIHDSVVISVSTFFFLSIFLIAISTLFFTIIGLKLFDSFTVAAATLCNVGPALGEFGPMESYASMPLAGKVWMIFLMLLGRLEIYTVLAVIIPSRIK